MRITKILFFVTLLLVGFSSCRQDAKKIVPDTSGIEVDVEIKRFEQDLFALDTNSLGAGLERLGDDYPEFSNIFFDQILGSSDPRIAPQGEVNYIKGFLNFPSVRALYDTCQITYPNLDRVAEEFREAFKLYRYYFPANPVPDITTFISEYSVAGFIYGQNSLAVGLDLYLGTGYPYAKYNPNNPAFSEYLVRTFNEEHLVSKTLQPLIEDMLGSAEGSRMLDLMVYNGKKLYLLDLLLPYTPDSIKLEVTGEQTEWLKENEFNMWAYFLDEELIYSSNNSEIRKFVDYSPHSPGMPPEAPGRTANFLGWQIIKAYMSRQPETTLDDLIKMKDAQAILDRSRYKPRN